MRSPFLRRFGIPSPFFDNETGFSPAALFALAEPGIWLDPSDLSTMFQDRAGTTPVTTPGQVVGYRRDKSGNNNHAVATADLNRGIYGIEPLGGTRNLLTYTEQFDNAVWVKTNTTATANTTVAPDGTLTADTVTGVLAANNNAIAQAFAPIAAQYTFSMWVRAGTATTGALLIRDDTAATNVAVTSSILSGPGSLTGSTVVTVSGLSTTEWTRISMTTSAALTAGNSARVLFYPETATPTNTTSKSNIIWGAQLELGTSATTYQRVVDQYNVTQAGVPTLHYVQYDGSNDTYLTPTITPGTDKVQVFTGIRKLSDATRAVFLEWSPASSNNGTFAVEAPAVATEPRFTFFSRGTLAVSPGVNNAIYAAPITQVMTGLGDISGDVATVRLNGTQVSRVTADQGTGNYLAYPLYIGRRNDASFPFNGRDYGIIVRFGANLTATQIADTEVWMNQRTGAY